jgi:hypothetical protein
MTDGIAASTVDRAALDLAHQVETKQWIGKNPMRFSGSRRDRRHRRLTSGPIISPSHPIIITARMPRRKEAPLFCI